MRKLWVAMDVDGSTYIFDNEPCRDQVGWIPREDIDVCIQIDPKMIHGLTWENSPKLVGRIAL